MLFISDALLKFKLHYMNALVKQINTKQATTIDNTTFEAKRQKIKIKK